MGHHGVFIGLTTLDLIYGVLRVPHSNEKQVTSQFEMAAGGPATNAAVTFRSFGNTASLLSAVGHHSLSEPIKSDLVEQRVELIDLLEDRVEPPPLSSILVTQSTGERAVISRNAVNLQATITDLNLENLQKTVLENAKIVLIDGHQIEVSHRILQIASHLKIPAVLDGGSWKPGLEKLLHWIDYVICSANFFPPSCSTPAEVFQFLKQTVGNSNQEKDIPIGIAMTYGEKPVRYFYDGQSGNIIVPSIQTVDSLGSGDVFHGAFCNFVLQTTFVDALQKATLVASESCRSFGTREWLKST